MTAGRGACQRLVADRVAMTALGGVLLLVLLALLAPVIACSRPFVVHVPVGPATTGFGALPAGWSFPWFSGLFDERLFASFVDRCSNGLLATALLPGFLLGVRRRGAPKRWRTAVLCWFLAGAMAAVFLTHGEPQRDWRARIARLAGDGIAVTAVFPPVPYAPNATAVLEAYQGPSPDHLLGTDAAGRDVFTALLYGLRVSLTIGLVAVSIYVALGVVLGAVAGYAGGRVDALVRRLIEVVACFPAFLLVLTLIALVRERSIFHVMVVIGLTGWPGVARLVRAELLTQRERDYAVAARALGVPGWRIVFRHLLPNCLAPVLVTAAFGVAGAILVESGLAFLHLGDASVASWGQVLRAGRDSGELHLILAPGLLIFATVTMMNLLAEGLRDAIDPVGRAPAARS